jgi:hypothetical protein
MIITNLKKIPDAEESDVYVLSGAGCNIDLNSPSKARRNRTANRYIKTIKYVTRNC